MADRIDSHHHLWRYTPAEYPWIGADAVSLRRDFTPEDLALELRKASIQGTVAVQARETVEETRALLAMAAQHSFIRGVVGWFPLTKPDVAKVLEPLAHNPKLKGVRYVLQDLPDDRFMMRDDFNQGVSQLRTYGLVYDLLIFARHLPQTVAFVDRHPNQPFVVDHIAKPDIRNGEFDKWQRGLRDLARRGHVCCKLSGVVTEADPHRWKEQVPRYIDAALETFGPSRMMFGSDWPVVLRVCSYSEWVDEVKRHISALSQPEQDAIMGGNAKRVYRLESER